MATAAIADQERLQNQYTAL